MAIAKYKFETIPQTVVTPEAKTLFMCLAEVNEVTGSYGGTLVISGDDINKETTFKEWRTNKKVKKGFMDGVNDLIDKALDEYNNNPKTKKKAVRADKIKVATDRDGNETEDFELSCKNKDQPKVVDKDRTRLPDFDKLVGNGSIVKAQISLVPYVMQGKVGVTAYLDYVLLKDLIEYGDSSDNPFDDEDFEAGSMDFEEETDDEDF
jgi:hypothetical protein